MKHLYNSKITIQELTSVDDVYGSKTITWADVSTLVDIPCRVNWLLGNARGETIVDGKIFWARDAKVYCAYYSDITADMRVVYNGVIYNIIDLGNVDEKGIYMILILRKGEI